MAVASVVLGLLLSACGAAPGAVQWRDLTLQAPAGWVEYENTSGVLGIADAPLDGEGARGARAVAVQFTHEPATVPQDWRDLVDAQGGTVEVDEGIEVDGIPATRIVYSWVTNGVPTREMVVLVPSRQIVILFQPVIEQGETDGPDRFLANRDTFDQVLAAIDFGAPRT